jgi:hypothetical protein
VKQRDGVLHSPDVQSMFPQLQVLPSRVIMCARVMPTPLMARHYLPFAGQVCAALG